MHAGSGSGSGSPPMNSVARRTRRQWDAFYKNLHNELLKKKKANVGDNEGSCWVNREYEGLGSDIGNSADKMGSVSGGSRGKTKRVNNDNGSCSNVGYEKSGVYQETVIRPKNKGMHVTVDAPVDLGKSLLCIDLEDSDNSESSSDTTNSSSDDSVVSESEDDDNSDEDYRDSENEEEDDDAHKDYKDHISISSDSNVSSSCSDDSSIKMIDHEENEQTEEEGCINVDKSKPIDEGRESELAGSKRNYEQYSDSGCLDDSQEVGDCTNDAKTSKNEDSVEGGLKKIKSSGIQDWVECNEEHDKEQISIARNCSPCFISRPQKKNPHLEKSSPQLLASEDENSNIKCVERTEQKGTRKLRASPGEKMTASARNIDFSKVSVDLMGKEAYKDTPHKKKTMPFDWVEKEADDATPLRKKRNRAANNHDPIKMLISCIEKDAREPVVQVSSLDNNDMIPEPLPLRFRFEDEEPPPLEKSEWEKEIESLFCHLEMGLRESEFGCSTYSMNNDDDDVISQDIDSTHAGCCSRGEHDPILDEQIGFKCKYCSTVIVEIEDILPLFYTPPPGRHDRREFYESQRYAFDQNNFQDSARENSNSSSIHVEGTVWDLIHGTKSTLFPHQRDGFEFIWKNIAGDILIEKLKSSPLSGDGKGCIISHAPGTGKTRLTIVFLQSFMKLYSMCRPVIIAPRGMLLTWEDEFRKWGFKIPFHNLNSIELSAEENAILHEMSAVGCHERNQSYIRLVKFSCWVKGSSILGISYQLFEKLVGEHRRKGQQDQIWKLLFTLPDLLVLDEGHTPRNHQSRTWKALTKVATNRRIILSGTPFQNNFRELYNTLCLVNPKFKKQIAQMRQSCKKGGRVTNGGKWTTLTIDKSMDKESTKLRNMINPFVHVHKGNILQESLPGLRDSLVFLRPTELQKSLLKMTSKAKPFFHEVCLVSLISVHPCLVAEKTMFSDYKEKLKGIESKIEEGVKLNFITKLSLLADALGERVLIFSTFLEPLGFIKQQLEYQFSWKEGREVLYMDGQLEENQRQNSISSFNDFSSKAKVLLASTKACSEGINLIGASRVVLLDTAWNPSVERQAISRAYRLGQKKVVHVYHLITSGTMEFRKYALQAQKDRISQLIFSSTDGAPSETSKFVAEDEIFEALIADKSFSQTFERIIHQPKASDLIETFDVVDHNW